MIRLDLLPPRPNAFHANAVVIMPDGQEAIRTVLVHVGNFRRAGATELQLRELVAAEIGKAFLELSRYMKKSQERAGNGGRKP